MLIHDEQRQFIKEYQRQDLVQEVKRARQKKSSKPGTLYGGPINDISYEIHNGHKYLRVPENFAIPKEWVEAHGHKFVPVGGGLHMPVIMGGSRQYFMDTLAEPPIANITAITATTETNMLGLAANSSALYTPIAANDPRPGKIYKVTIGGIWSNATTGALTITPRYGIVIGGITFGTNINALTVLGTAVTNGPYFLEFVIVCRTVGLAGANSTLIGTGFFMSGGLGATGSAPMAIAFGGTSATADVSVASGVWMGWTLTVAGTMTPQYAFIQSLN